LKSVFDALDFVEMLGATTLCRTPAAAVHMANVGQYVLTIYVHPIQVAF
jgi:hypothetical protein